MVAKQNLGSGALEDGALPGCGVAYNLAAAPLPDDPALVLRLRDASSARACFEAHRQCDRSLPKKFARETILSW
jgi:hypothetical protein